MTSRALLLLSALMMLPACGGDAGPGGVLDPTSPACRDDYEANDQMSGATRLSAGKPISGAKACAGDVDFYSVELAEGETLDVHVALATSAAPESVGVSIHEATAGMAIAAGTADGDGLSASSQPGKAGTYYVRVTGVGAGKNAYTLTGSTSANTVQCTVGTHAQNGGCVVDGCDDFGLEPNEDIAGGRRIVPGAYKGLTSCKGDVDYFVLRAPPGGGALQVSVTNISTGVDVYATDGSMNGPIPQIIGAGQAGDDQDYLTNVPVATGDDVWVFVVGGKGGTYDLELGWTDLDPKRDCLTACRELVKLDGPVDPSEPEAVALGYYDGSEPQYLYGRRDFVMQIKWAMGRVAQTFPGTHPVYISDIGQADGNLPGTDVGVPRHPSDAHIHGHDADIAYYQNMPDNDYRIICGDGSDHNGNGQPGKYNDGSFCTTSSNVIDWPREAYFLAMMAENPLYHVTGMDVTLPNQCLAAIDGLLEKGTITPRLAYKIYNGIVANKQFWPFHHHHVHTQVWNPDQPELPLTYEYYLQ